jgi:hypothetical protein
LCVGKLIKFVAIAYACQAGIEGVRRFFHWG